MRWRRALAMGMAIVVGWAVAGCGTDSGGGTLAGLQRTPPLQVGDVTLPEVTTAEPGTPYRFRAAPGELLVVYFGFTNCPDLCPTTLADLRSARKRIGADASRVDLALVTVDPRRDTADILRRYAGSYTTKFHVLRTTDPTELKAAEDAFLASSSVVTRADGSIGVSHTATAYVVDDTGTVRVEWPFGIGAKGMTNDLEILIRQLKERT